MWGSGFDAGGDQDAAQTLTGMGGAHTNSFPSFVPAAQPAADTAAGSAAGEASGPAGTPLEASGSIWDTSEGIWEASGSI